MGAERNRLAAADAGTQAWRAWGPYVAERAWGTVREDYSASGDAWTYFPYDHARSRTYRWNEDGMAAVCDLEQTWCLGLALWNGVDSHLKERMFGLSGPQGNHGEDAKDYWWYVDSTPTHSWMSWRYHYPQRAFPYEALVTENARRGRDVGEYELEDTRVFADGRYWAVVVDYAKADTDDLLMTVTVTNCGPEAATLHVLPTLWFRNTWAWDAPGTVAVPQIVARDSTLAATHPEVGALTVVGDGAPTALACDNETNAQRLYGVASRSPYPKDGINDAVVTGAPTVNPDGVGTKAALHYVLDVPAGESRTIRLRMSGGNGRPIDASYDAVLAARRAEADEFYAELTPPALSTDDAHILRQALAGMLWGKQFFHYDVERWLTGDPAEPTPPDSRWRGRNVGWQHLDNRDVISMPDPWEYPWYAAWDLAFHCVPLAHVDPEFAKRQLVLMLREWYMHPSGQLPAYEWSFDDVNPPVHAWACLQVFLIDGGRDFDFLARVLPKLLLNFTWWVNRKDSEGNNVFSGGFLGLDNIGPIDRSVVPGGASLEQADGTAWMAAYCLTMLEISLRLAEHDGVWEDLTTKFFEHFAYIAHAMTEQGLWDESDGFFYDVLHLGGGTTQELRVRSVVGLLPLCASMAVGSETLAALPDFARRMAWFVDNKLRYADVVRDTRTRPDGGEATLLAVVHEERLRRIAVAMFDEAEFLSPHGIRALSRRHLAEPFVLQFGGASYSVDYEPGESLIPLFGGNSNWRGPVWMPVNYLLVSALRRYGEFYGDAVRVELPSGSGHSMTLNEAADAIADRLVSLFRADADGRRVVYGDSALLQSPGWRENVMFYEYFHGDDGHGIGASHQTGWTGLVAALLLR